MKLRDYIYIICMIFFAVLAYLLFDRGVNVRTKNIVNYQENSDIVYKVYLKENNEFNKPYLNMEERYITSLVDKINIDFNYNDLFSKEVNGYYSYSVIGTIHGYLNDINESVWDKEYKLIDNKTEVINQNNIKNIKIEDRVIIDFDKYKNELANFSKKYGLNLSGYMDVVIKVKENLNFKGIDKVIEDEKEMRLTIPLSYETFKITIDNDNNNISNYYDFSTREKLNYVLLVMGAFSLSLSISFLALVIREMVIVSDSKTKYIRELNKILNNYEDKIVKIKRFYNKKKYNLIYVDSFMELLDVYEKVGNPISYREVKKDEEAIFLIIDDDNAWIYQMIREKKK